MSEPNRSGISDNTIGAIAYITCVPAIAFLILVPYKKSSFVRFHAWQSIFLNFVALVVSYVAGFILSYCGITGVSLSLPFTLIIGIFWMLVWVICAILALNGKRFKLPIIGSLAEKQANG